MTSQPTTAAPTQVMQGVRILEVAEHTFVPAASALLADYGAEVIKIEHVERGDAMRGLASSGLALFGGGVHALLEHSNRGKHSLGLDLTSPDGLDVLYRLAATCDVFLTNKLPSVRTKLKVDIDDIRAHNPNIIYVRGTGQGERGPDADQGSYDSLGYWSRGGVALGMTPPSAEFVTNPPAAFGDSIGAMTIAGGIMGALYSRERTGHAPTVDISLLGTGLWSMGAAMALSLHMDRPWLGRPAGTPSGNPLAETYQTGDDRFVALTCLQAAKYWPEFTALIGEPELATDERFADAPSLFANSGAATDVLRAEFARRTGQEWYELLQDFSGQWAMVQTTSEAAVDPQTLANGYIAECTTSAGAPFQLVSAPVQYDGAPAPITRGPDFNEHGDAILTDLGLDWDTIVDLKVRGVVA